MHNIDINKTVDAVKLKWYHEWLATHIYDEGESGFHKDITRQVVEKYFDPLNLPKTAKILDVGCGPGYFMDNIKERGYTNYIGTTLSEGDINLCQSKGHTIETWDISFLPQQHGYTDESIDFIFCRHALEHSPYPLFTLAEYNRVLVQGRPIYIELPAPNCERQHEFNLNHYSILGDTMWVALLQRTGFNINKFETIEFDLNMPYKDDSGQWVLEDDEIEVKNERGETVKARQPKLKPVREKFYCIVATKARPLDLK